MHFRKGGSNMARNAKPWYNGERNCWMAYLNGRKVRLADGKGNRKAAQARLTELLFQRSSIRRRRGRSKQSPP